MSRFARDWAWTLPVPPPQKLVILALAERADDSGTCWPSLTHLTEMTGLVRSTVALALIGLEDAHLIVRDRGLHEGVCASLGAAREARAEMVPEANAVVR
jgi:DNA-binding MarR family transcriptional regulator